MKPLLVGEAPSKNETDPKPLEGRIGKRLAACAGLTLDEYLERFDRVNLLDVRQDTVEHGFTFDMAAGHASAVRLRQTWRPGQVVVLLGQRVASCFGAISKPLFEPYCLHDGIVLYVAPHPSGVNRWWNTPANVENMCAFMRSLL